MDQIGERARYVDRKIFNYIVLHDMECEEHRGDYSPYTLYTRYLIQHLSQDVLV